MVSGDLLDTPGVVRQITGQDVVIVSINSRTVATFVDGGASIIAAARALGPAAPRIIWIGGASSLKNETGRMLFEVNPIPNAPVAAAPGHIQVLQALKAANDVPWTFLSPAVVTAPGTRTGTFRIGDDHVLYDAAGKSAISMEDLAIVAVDEAEQARHLHRQFTAAY